MLFLEIFSALLCYGRIAGTIHIHPLLCVTPLVVSYTLKLIEAIKFSYIEVEDDE